MKKTCKQCNNEFNGRSNAYYCSGNCRKLAFKHSIESVAKSVASLAETEKASPEEATDKSFVPNWKRLHARYPDKIKSKSDALRYAAHCVLQSVPQAILIIGDSVYGNKGTDADLDQPQMASFV